MRGKKFTGNYCNNCGQKAGAQKLTLAVVVEESLHFFTHFEKGFLYTFWGFISKPGVTSLNYLNGKRKQYQNL